MVVARWAVTAKLAARSRGSSSVWMGEARGREQAEFTCCRLGQGMGGSARTEGTGGTSLTYAWCAGCCWRMEV